MEANNFSISTFQRLVVAKRCRHFQRPKVDRGFACASIIWYWDILGAVRGELDKQTSTGIAFVQLAGRMKEARPIANSCCQSEPVAQPRTKRCQCRANPRGKGGAGATPRVLLIVK